MQTVAARVAAGARRPRARQRPRPRRRGAARDRPPAPPPLPRRAVPPAPGRDRRAPPADAGRADRRDRRRARAATRTPRRSTPSSRRSSTRWSRTALGRVAWGEVADLRWQLATFGFHLASLEVRQHAAVHRAALEALRARRRARTSRSPPASRVAEVLATFRSIARLQARFGVEACRRYVISFTTSPDDVADVLELARLAARARAVRPPGRPPSPTCRRPCPSSTSCRCSRAPTPSPGADGAARRPARATRPTAPTSGSAATPRR